MITRQSLLFGTAQVIKGWFVIEVDNLNLLGITFVRRHPRTKVSCQMTKPTKAL